MFEIYYESKQITWLLPPCGSIVICLRTWGVLIEPTKTRTRTIEIKRTRETTTYWTSTCGAANYVTIRKALKMLCMII